MSTKLTRNSVATWDTGQSTNADSSAGYEALTGASASYVTISNNTGTTIDIRKSGTSSAPFELASGTGVTLPVITTVAEIEWKRSDDAATSVTISYTYGF